MTTQLTLQCPYCYQTFQNTTILLPRHESHQPNAADNGWHLEKCIGSDCLAKTIIRDGITAPLALEFETYINHEFGWQSYSEEKTRHDLGIFYRNVDEMIAEMYAGDNAYAGCELRVKPR